MAREGRLALPETRVAFDLASVAPMRRQMRAELRQQGVAEPVIDDALLVLSEMMGNALRHARPVPVDSLIVAYEIGPAGIEIMVSDGAEDLPAPARPTLFSQSGRGLRIIGRLAHDWGVRSGDVGKTVWARLHASGTGGDGGLGETSGLVHGFPR